MGLGIVKLGQGQWAVKDGNLLAAKETNGRLKNAEFTVTRGTRATYVGRDGLIKESNLQDVNLVNNGDFSELGSELVTNGTFDTDSDWGKSGGATISGGTGNIIGDGSSFTSLIKADVFTVGKTYKITVDVTINSGLGLKFQDGSTNENFGFATTSGSYTFYGTANNADFVIGRRTGGTAFDSTVDNVSIKEVDPNDYWTFSGDSFTFPDGAVRIARTTSTTFIQQNVLTSGRLYKVEFDVLDKPDNNGTFIVRLGANNVYDVSTYEGTRFSKYITSSGIDFRIYSSSDNGVIYVDNIVVSEVKTDTPRIDFTDNTDGHLLLEPQSTNLLTYSEDFTNWTKLNGGTGSLPVVTANTTISPSGEQNADTIFFDKGAASGGGDYSLLRLDYGGADVDGTASIYLKADANVDIEISSDDGSYQTVSVTNTWQRFSVSDATSDRLSMGLRGTVPSNNTATVYAWGGQLEALSHPTSYIPTNGSTVTRDADRCTGSGEAVDFNSEEGVLYAEIAALNNNINFSLLSLSDGTNNNRIYIGFGNLSNQITGSITSSSALQALMYNTIDDITEYSKIAIKYKLNDVSLYVNGTKVDTDTSATMPILTSLQFTSGFGGSPFYGKCKTIRVYKEALSDTDLENLTS